MTFESILVPILAFLLGSLTSSLFWMLKYGERLTKIEANQYNMQVKLNSILPADPHPCQFHIDLDKRVVGVETTVYGTSPGS